MSRNINNKIVVITSQAFSLLNFRLELMKDMLPWNNLKPILDGFRGAIADYDYEKLRDFLIEPIPSLKPQYEITDVTHKEKL